MERRLAVHARTSRQKVMAVATALLLASAPAHAAPKGADAKLAFDRGVAAYQAKDYPGASAALGKSFALEPDVETLYAWAQAERQQEHCDKAIELYNKILTFDLPDENKQVVRDKLDECKGIIAAQKPVVEPAKQAPEPHPPVIIEPAKPEGLTWWKDPIGGGLVVAGVVGIGVGGYFLRSASQADGDAKQSTNYFETERLNDKAESHGRTGVLAGISGGVLLVGGIIWYATRGKQERTALTGWIAPSGGGLAAIGRF